MNAYYNVEIQMEGNKKVTTGILVLFEDFLGISDRDIDEREDHHAVLFFESDMKPIEVMNRVRTILNQTSSIHYVDVVYRYEYEMTPDRFVCWKNGDTQEYTGHVIFEEDK